MFICLMGADEYCRLISRALLLRVDPTARVEKFPAPSCPPSAPIRTKFAGRALLRGLRTIGAGHEVRCSLSPGLNAH
jgi:hypothetical protein